MCLCMRLCAVQKRRVLTNKIKVFLRDEFKFCDESLDLKTHRRTEKKCYLVFFLMCLFMRLCAAQKRRVLTNKIKVFLTDEFKF